MESINEVPYFVSLNRNPMYELTIGGVRLSTIGAELRALKADAAKVISEELKKANGFIANIRGEVGITNVSMYSARAYQHIKNAVSIGATLDIPVSVIHDTENFLYKTVMDHPQYQESQDMILLANALIVIETNPYNWA